MTYQTPIYDRSADDIENLTAKAFFNVSDWLRVYQNSEVVHALVELLLSLNISFDTVTSPTITTIPTVGQLNTVLANIERIRVAANLPAVEGLSEIVTDWMAGSSMDAPTYIDANQWESVLDAIYRSVPRVVEYQPYCGVFGAGQMRYWQNRFRIFAGFLPTTSEGGRSARTGVAVAGSGIDRNNGFRRFA